MPTRVESWTTRLIKHASEGKVLDLFDEKDASGVPILGKRWQPSRSIPGGAVVAALYQIPHARHGLRIRGALIEGLIDLRNFEVSSGFEFSECEIRGEIDLRGATIGWMRISQSRVRSIWASNMKANNDAQLSGCELEPGDQNAPAIDFDQATIGGDLLLDMGLTVSGNTRLARAKIGGNLSLRGAKLSFAGETALNFDAAIVGGDAFLDSGFSVEGGVHGLGARIWGQLVLSGASINHPNLTALALDGFEVSGGAFLDAGFSVVGEIHAPGSLIKGQLILNDATITNPGSAAIVLDRARIEGDLMAGKGLSIEGEMRALGSVITGQLVLSGAELQNPGDDVLSLDGAKIGGGAFLDDGFHAKGHVRALRAHVAGQLVFNSATIESPNQTALSLDGAEIVGDAFFDEKFSATGEVRALGIIITGTLSFQSATIRNPGGKALSLDGARIDGGFFLNRGFSAFGEVRAVAATIVGHLSLDGASLINPDKTALNLEGTSVVGRAHFYAQISGQALLSHTKFELTLTWYQPRVSTSAGESLKVNISNASIGFFNLYLGDSSFARFDFTRCTISRLQIDRIESLRLDNAAGLTLTTVQGSLLSNPRAVVRLLTQLQQEPASSFIAQPWKELAGAIERAGEPGQARRIRWEAAKRVTASSWWLPRWTTRRLYSYTVGYGYYPLLTLVWIIFLWAGVVGISTWLQADFVPTDWHLLQELNAVPAMNPSPLVSYPTFNPFLYALDTALPVSSSGQAAAWRLEGHDWIAAVFAGVKAASWALTALLIAGITGVLRKD
jgi:hypothetical protein